MNGWQGKVLWVNLTDGSLKTDELDPQVIDVMAVECGMDAGFGRGTKGRHVASFIVGKMMGKKNHQAG